MQRLVWGEVARAVEGKTGVDSVLKAMGNAALVLWRGGWDERFSGTNEVLRDCARRLQNTRARSSLLRGLADRIGNHAAHPVRREGQVIGALVVGEDLAEAGDALAIILSQAIDASDQRDEATKLLREVARLRQELDDSARHRTALLSQARHDLRTPLTAMKGYADMINRGMAGPVTPTLKRYVERIGAAVERECELLEERLSESSGPTTVEGIPVN